MKSIDKIDEIIDKMKDEIIQQTQQLIKIRSVEEEPEPGMPFGRGVNQALEYVIDLSKALGFKVKNVDSYAGHAEFGQGEDIVGVVVHLDVVPEGSNWTYPPYEGEIHHGRIYGRGAVDDKGPTIAVLYGLKAIKELGLPLKKRVRVIFGTNEESNWEGINYYLKKEEKPCCGFAPDAQYPVINSEKGILIFKMVEKFENRKDDGIEIKYIKGGNRANMVPDYCEAELRGISQELLKAEMKVFLEKTGFSMEVVKTPGAVRIKSYGKSAHGSLPEKGQNAIGQMLLFLNRLNLAQNEEQTSFIKFLAEEIGMEYYGESIGLDLEDEVSGKLVLNLGVIDINQEMGSVEINIRYPVKYKKDDVINRLKASISETGIEITDIKDKPPLYVSKDNFLVKKLKAVYEKVTGLRGEPISIGGGTYARAIQNAVAFGPLFPGQPELAHQKDEYISIDDLIMNTKIYARAIHELAK